MEIIQTHIPDIPLWKDAGILTLATTQKSGFMDFLRENGKWILAFLIVGSIVGSIIYAYRKSKKEDEVKPNQALKNVVINTQNPYKNGQ
jgi:predicted negative regulator of RcsB-dependent stress response